MLPPPTMLPFAVLGPPRAPSGGRGARFHGCNVKGTRSTESEAVIAVIVFVQRRVLCCLCGFSRRETQTVRAVPAATLRLLAQPIDFC